MKRKFKLVAAIGLTALAAAATSQASTSTTTMAVSATVPSICTVSATQLNFGTVSSNVSISSSSHITVSCARDLAYNVTIDAGRSFGSHTRQLANGADRLPYQLFKDAGGSQEWGDEGFAGTYTVPGGATSVAGIGTSADQDLIVYGVLAPSGAYGAGNYTDAVAVTVYF